MLTWAFLLSFTQAIGAAPNAARMQRVVSFYEKLPRGAAPEVKASGFLGRYQAKHFGKKTSAKRTSGTQTTRHSRRRPCPPPRLWDTPADLSSSHHPRACHHDCRRLCPAVLLPPAYVPAPSTASSPGTRAGSRPRISGQVANRASFPQATTRTTPTKRRRTCVT